MPGVGDVDAENRGTIAMLHPAASVPASE
jgi:hypothetical protein